MTIRIFYVNTAKEDDMAFNYKDPRWQMRRLEIMKRDNVQCVVCGDKKSELHVHHKRYKGQPWEAEDDDMQTLCMSCHEFLGRHPKAGIWYLPKKNIFHMEIVVEHCPACKAKDFCFSFSEKVLFCKKCKHKIPYHAMCCAYHLPSMCFKMGEPPRCLGEFNSIDEMKKKLPEQLEGMPVGTEVLIATSGDIRRYVKESNGKHLTTEEVKSHV
jgi:hypothetical protein